MSFADKVSLLRIVLIPVFVSLLMYSRIHPLTRHFAVAVFVLAMLTDFFDGMVARIKKEKSEFGQIIDPLADKLLLLTAFIVLYVLPQFPVYLWLVLVVVSRDLIILVGVVVLHLLKIDITIAPSVWGKLTTFFQMGTVLWFLIGIPYYFFVSLIAVIFTVISGMDYFLRGAKEINAHINSVRH